MYHRNTLSLLFVIICILFLSFSDVTALNNGLGLKPQMGWNSWNHYHCDVSESLIRATADSIVRTGLNKFGYEYVNIDDCWALPDRDSHNMSVADPKTFPSGMFALGQYIHSLGLKFGIYSDAGTKTCAGRVGSLGFEPIDALTYAAWDVDYLKYDNCNNDGIDYATRFRAMGAALNATGKPIFYSLCVGSDFKGQPTYSPPIGNSWRTTDDINTSWQRVMKNLDGNAPWWNVSGPGAWNDPDMLEVGNGLTQDEEISHFSLWCLMKAPLIIGADVTSLSSSSYEILTNAEVIGFDQDDLGIQGKVVMNTTNYQVYAGPLADGSIAVVAFNRDDNNSMQIKINWSDIGLDSATAGLVRDLWDHQDIGNFTGSYQTKSLNPHASQTLKITPLMDFYRKDSMYLRERKAQ